MTTVINDKFRADAVKVLIVEDELLVAEDIRMSLGQMGYRVVGMSDSGLKAVGKAADLSPDIVLMDIMLKDSMNGIEAARRIREKQNVPIIYLTAHSDPHTLKMATDTSPYGYLIKPFDEHELQCSIDGALARHRQMRG